MKRTPPKPPCFDEIVNVFLNHFENDINDISDISDVNVFTDLERSGHFANNFVNTKVKDINDVNVFLNHFANVFVNNFVNDINDIRDINDGRKTSFDKPGGGGAP